MCQIVVYIMSQNLRWKKKLKREKPKQECVKLPMRMAPMRCGREYTELTLLPTRNLIDGDPRREGRLEFVLPRGEGGERRSWGAPRNRNRLRVSIFLSLFRQLINSWSWRKYENRLYRRSNSRFAVEVSSISRSLLSLMFCRVEHLWILFAIMHKYEVWNKQFVSTCLEKLEII